MQILNTALALITALILLRLLVLYRLHFHWLIFWALLAGKIAFISLIVYLATQSRTAPPDAINIIFELGLLYLTLFSFSLGELKRGLNRDHQLFESIFDNSPAGLAILTPKGHVLNINPQIIKIFDLPATKIIGQNIFGLKIMTETGIANNFDQCVQNGKNITSEYYLKNLKNPLYLNVSISPIINQGKITFVQIIVRDITSRKELEKDIIRQANFLREVINLDPNLIFVRDTKGRFVLVNEAYAKAYNTTIVNCIGKTDADFLPDDPEKIKQIYVSDHRIMETLHDEVRPEQVLIDFSTGKPRWFKVYKRAIKVNGDPPLVLGILNDITERKLAEDQLRQTQQALIVSESRYRDIIETAEDVSLVINIDRGEVDKENVLKEKDILQQPIIILASPSATVVFGKHPSNIVGSSFFEFIQPNELSRLVRDYKLWRVGAFTKVKFEAQHINTKDGELRWIEWAFDLSFNRYNNLQAIFAIGRDITRRKLNEVELRENQDTLTQALQLATMSIDQLMSPYEPYLLEATIE